MNINFQYLYRDAGNYKQYGEVIFTNATSIDIATIDKRIRECLIEGEWFYAKEWGLKTLYHFKWDDELDHSYHEFAGVTEIDEPADSNDIADFLKLISNAQ